MDREEALELLRRHLESYRRRSCLDLTRLIGKVETAELAGASGAAYQLEVAAHWDAAPGGSVRVVGTIDDGGWRAILPVSEDFIMAPGGAFVDE